jgi:hypothetical protein
MIRLKNFKDELLQIYSITYYNKKMFIIVMLNNHYNKLIIMNRQIFIDTI